MGFSRKQKVGILRLSYWKGKNLGQKTSDGVLSQCESLLLLLYGFFQEKFRGKVASLKVNCEVVKEIALKHESNDVVNKAKLFAFGGL